MEINFWFISLMILVVLEILILIYGSCLEDFSF